MWLKWHELEKAYIEAMNTEDCRRPTIITCHVLGVTALIFEARQAGVPISDLKRHFEGWSAKWKPIAERRPEVKCTVKEV
jgi:hypothetical protein